MTTTTARTAPDVGTVGTFHATAPRHGRGHDLDGWHITTDLPDLASKLTEVLSGKIITTAAGGFKINTAARSVPILVNGPADLVSDLCQPGPTGLLHHCNGTHHLSPADKHGAPCGCPPLLADRKIRAHNGTGPAPHTSLRFHLATHPHLGAFHFESASWPLALTAPALTTQGPTLCHLTIRVMEFTTASGLRLPTPIPAITVDS